MRLVQNYSLIPCKMAETFQQCFTLLGYRTKTPLWPEDGGDVTVVVVAGAFVVLAGALVVTLNYSKTKQFNFCHQRNTS